MPKNSTKTIEARLGLRTWIEIDKSAITHNYETFRKIIGSKIKLLSVVKSNAYGHGLVDFSREVVKLGVDWLGVDSVVEAFRLRREGIETPILVLGYTLPELMQKSVEENASITISNLFSLQGLKNLKLNGKIKVHIKVDTGMHRQGFMEGELQEVLIFLEENKNSLEVQGLYTHFAEAKDPVHPQETNKQIEVFNKWIRAFQVAGLSPIIHAAATGATMIFPNSHFDMVRVGIGMHGLWPSDEIKAHLHKKIQLQPTLIWKTIISELKTIPKGARLGYDLTESVTRETRLAVCPIGYWHGYPRSLSSVGIVLINGVRAKVLGRVSMDMITVDVTDVPDPKIGDEVVLVGQSNKEYLGASEVAKLAGVSVYEFVTRINPLIKKLYT